MTTEPNLQIRNLTKAYRGGLLANDRINLDIRPGEVFGLLGPNGAGKTTLVSQIIGLLKPTSGEIRLGGEDLIRKPHLARRLCSYLPQAQIPLDPLPMQTAIELIGRIRGGDRRRVKERTEALLERLELGEWRRQTGYRLSGGVKRLVGFVMAAVCPGRLVILDEPTNDVDPLRRRLLWREIRDLAGGGISVLLVTHNVLEAERAVDRLAILDHGRILVEGTPSSLKKEEGGRLRLELTLEPQTACPPAPSFARLQAATGRRALLHVEDEQVPEALEWARSLARAGVAESYELGPATLEDAYLRVIGRSDALSAEDRP